MNENPLNKETFLSAQLNGGDDQLSSGASESSLTISSASSTSSGASKGAASSTGSEPPTTPPPPGDPPPSPAGAPDPNAPIPYARPGQVPNRVYARLDQIITMSNGPLDVYSMLRNGCASLYYKKSILERDVETLRGYGYKIARFNCDDWMAETEQEFERLFYEEARSTLGSLSSSMPDFYFYHECLEHFLYNDYVSNGGLAVVFIGFDRFLKRFPVVAERLIDDTQYTSYLFLLYGKKLVALLQSDDPFLTIHAFPQRTMDWNAKEWETVKRLAPPEP